MTQTYEINGRIWHRGEEFVWKGEKGTILAVSEMLTMWLVSVKGVDGRIHVITVPKGVVGLQRDPAIARKEETNEPTTDR